MLDKAKLKKEIKVIDIIVLVLIVIIAVLGLIGYNFLKEQLNTEIIIYGLIGLFFMTFILELFPNILNPYLGLLLGMASGFGIFNSVLAVSLGSVFGSSLGFFIGHKYGFKFVSPLFKEKTLEKVIKFWNKYGKGYVFFSAITPLPYFPLVFGSFRLDWKNFLIFGTFARVASFVVVGLLTYVGFAI